MKIISAEFVKSAVRPDGYPDLDLPEIAFVGRSNTGKSSLINRLLNRKSLAKTSSTPGKTRLINFFLINKKIVFVDLPGYGYAKVSKSERGRWGKMAGDYFSSSRRIKGVVLLHDIRRDQNERDRVMLDMLSRFGKPVIYVLTKADKFSRNGRMKRAREIERELQHVAAGPIIFSATAKLGMDELWGAITDVVERP